MDETYDVVVIGAGIAGLAAGATAAGAGSSVLILDRCRSRPAPSAESASTGQAAGRGGRGGSDQVGRFRFNRGAHALYRTTPGRAVLDRLGVQVVGHPPPTRGGQGQLGDRIGLLPVSASSLARTTLLGAKDKLVGARLLAGMGRWRPDELAGMTTVEWFDQLGVEGRLRRLFEMLARLTSFVADLETASADLVASQTQMALTGSVDYLHDGWSGLIDQLVAVASQRGARVEGGHRVHAVVPEGRRVKVELDEREIVAGRVVLAAGTIDANAALLPEAPRAWSQGGPAARVACLDLGLASVPATALLLGIDRPLYLSRHAPPAGLAPPGGAVYQTMRYLRADEDPTPEDARAELVEHCRAAGIEPENAEEVRYLHRMVVCGALPTPATGGMRGRPGVDTGIEGVLVAGDWVGPSGHLSDASLVSGEAAGQAAARALAHETVVRPVGG